MLPAWNSRRVSRRTALRGLAAGLAAPMVVSARVLGREGTPPSERVLIGAIGVGNRGMDNVNAHRPDIVALCDVDSKRLGAAQAKVEKSNGAKCATCVDYRKLLDDKSIDAVAITTPDHWHALQTIDACRAGKDVFCEKPLTLTIAEGQAMVAAARKYGRIVQTGSQQRSAENFRRACELVRNGRLGKIHTIRVGISGVNFAGPPVADGDPPPELNYDLWLGPAPQRPYNVKRVHYNFRFFWDYSGGQITNWGAHHLDIAHWAMGWDETGPRTITGRAKYHPEKWYEVPQWFEVTYEYPGGVRVISGMDQPGGTTFEGDRGTLHVNRGLLKSTPAEIVREPLGEKDVRLTVSPDHAKNWLESIRTRKPPICDVAIGHRTASACHLGNIAIQTGRTITWDAAKETIEGDAEAAKKLSREYRAPWRLET